MRRQLRADTLRRAGLLSIAGMLLLMPLLLAQVAYAQNTDDLEQILQKTQSRMETFANDFSLIRYDEDVVQQKLRNDQKVLYKQETLFDSMTRIKFEEGKLYVDEQRLTEKPPARVELRPLLNTYGFSILAMIFHPYYASSFRFTGAGEDNLDGKVLARVKLEHIANTPTPVLYQLIGADKPLELTGTAWIDPSTGDICKIDAEFAFESNDIGVKSIRAELLLAPVLLRAETTPRYLPVSATIDLETPKQHWRNIHHFSDYRKYRVTTNMGVASE